MSETTLALCMAGLYRRFRDAGYTTPKYLLPFQGASILRHVARELRPKHLLLVANRREQGFRDQITAELVADGLRPDLIFVDDTRGQAETAAMAARAVVERGWEGPIAFHNVDTIVYGRDLDQIGSVLMQADGFIDVFDSDSPAFSYVTADDTVAPARVTAIVEKRVISRHATTGLYGFRSPACYLHSYAATPAGAGEAYISDVYQTMLADDQDVRTDLGGDRGTLVLGTPAEYEAAIAEMRP